MMTTSNLQMVRSGAEYDVYADIIINFLYVQEVINSPFRFADVLRECFRVFLAVEPIGTDGLNCNPPLAQKECLAGRSNQRL